MEGLSQRPTTAGIEQVQDLIQAHIPIGHRNGMQQVHRSDFPHASISRIGQKSEFVVHIPDLQTIQSGLGTVAQILGIRNSGTNGLLHVPHGEWVHHLHSQWNWFYCEYRNTLLQRQGDTTLTYIPDLCIARKFV